MNLKPCPWCGNEDHLVTTVDGETYAAHCIRCGTTGPRRLSEDEATDAWNRRATDPALERLKEVAVEMQQWSTPAIPVTWPRQICVDRLIDAAIAYAESRKAKS